MEEIIGAIRENLDSAGELVEVILNAISLLFIVAGVVISIVKSIQERMRRPASQQMHMFFRMLLGGWLVVALEFQLAADIVGTIISPTSEHLIQLGAVALIRTFLNYFLSKELKEGMDEGKSVFEK